MVPDGRTDDAKTISPPTSSGDNKNDPQKKHRLGKYMHEVLVSRCVKVPHVKGVVRRNTSESSKFPKS